jgi:hypothetical protein
MPKYKLKSPYWDGQNMHMRGEVISVSEGTEAPRGSILIEEEEPQLALDVKPEQKKK